MNPPACPEAVPNLEHLINTDQLVATQRIGVFESRNDFNVVNSANVEAFRAKYVRYRLFKGMGNPTKLEMAIFDVATDREILHIKWKSGQGCEFTDYKGEQNWGVHLEILLT